MSSPSGHQLPSALIESKVEWADTDASGHYHHSTVLRWVEAAEAALLAELGLDGLYGTIPRVHFEVDLHARRWFGDTVRTALRIHRVGRASVTYSFSVHHLDELTASGLMVAVHTDSPSGRATPWPDQVRAAFSSTPPDQYA